MTAPRVLVLSDYSGIVWARAEAEIFLGLARAGVEVTVMTGPGSPWLPRFREHGVRVVEWHPASKLSPGDVRRLRAAFREHRPHAVFLMNNLALANGAFAAIGLPVAVVAYRGYDGNVSWTDPTNWWKLLHPRVDVYWCNAESVRATIEAALPRGRKGRAVAIPKGHDVRWYDGTRPADLRALGVPAGAFTVAFAANVRAMKGVPDLLRATAFVPPERNLHLLFMGHGMDAPDLRALVAASPMRDRIHVLGSRRDVLEILAACDGYVCSSLKGESLTRSLMESMSLGLPAVITDVPGNRGIVVDGECGRVVPRGDPAALGAALADLASDPERARAWGRAARRRIETTWNHAEAVSRMLALVRDLAARAGAAA